MDHRDLDRWARLVASSCSRRRTLQVLGAGALAFGVGRRARFDALAAEPGCCKCSGTLRCELDVATYGECVTVCGPRRQAIFAPNYTCTRGNSLSSVCKPKRRATDLALLAGAPGVYDLAFVDRAGAATIPGLFPVTTEALFTAEAAIAAGFVQETAAAALFEGGVQVYHSLWQDAADTIAVINHLSQHLTAEAATTFFEYAVAQLQPADVETFELELSGIDAGILFRFAFPSQTRPGATISRLMAITLTGEFVTWTGIDGVDTTPDPDVGRTFAQAVVDALIDRPEQTASLAPYVSLLSEAAACLPEFQAAAAKRAGMSAARGPAGFQDDEVACEAPVGNIRYPVWGGMYVPRLGLPQPQIEINQRFFLGADRLLEQTYTIGGQTVTIAIANWADTNVLANDGQDFFARRAEVDEAFGVIRQDLDLPHDGATGQWFCTSVAFDTGEQWIYGVGAVAFAPPYSFSLGVFEPGEPLEEQSSWATNGSLPRTGAERILELIDGDYERLLGDVGAPATYATFFDARYSAPPQADEVVSGGGEADATLLHDFGATAAALGLSPAFSGYKVSGGLTLLTAEAAEDAMWVFDDDDDTDAEEILRKLFNEQGLRQMRIDHFATDAEAETVELTQFEFPDRASASQAAAELGGRASGFDPTELSVPDRDGSGLTWQSLGENGEDPNDTMYLAGRVDKIVVTATRTRPRQESPNRSEESTAWADELLADLAEAYDEDEWAGEVGVAAQEVTPWMPLMKGGMELRDDLILIDGVRLSGDDPDRTEAANPDVQTARVGSFRLTDPGEIEVQWGVRSFSGTLAATTFLELMPDHRPEGNWFTGQPLSGLAEVHHVVYGVTVQHADGVPLVGAHVAIQAEENIVFDFAALVPFTGDPAAFPAYDATTDPRFGPLSDGIASTYLTLDTFVENLQPRLGFYWDPMLEPPSSWQFVEVPVVGEGGEADPTLRRDFGAATAALERSPHMAGLYDEGESGTTYFSAKNGYGGDHKAFEPAVIGPLFNEHGLLQVRVEEYYADGAAETLRLDQHQFPDRTSAEAGFDVLARAATQRGQADFTVEIPGQQRSVTVRSAVVDARGREVVRHETVVQVGEIVVAATYDTVNPQTDPTERLTAVLGDLLVAYDDDEWAGEVGVAVQGVTPWMPIVKDQAWFFYRYGIVDEEVAPLAGEDAAQTAAMNPWVRNALFGRYDLTGTWTPINLSFAVRDFPDQETSDGFWLQWDDLIQDDRSDNWSWTLAASYVKDEIPHVAYGGTRYTDDGRYQVGANLAFQAGRVVVRLDAFTEAEYTGDPEGFADYNALVDTSYLRLSDGLGDLTGQIVSPFSGVVREPDREYEGYLPSTWYALPRSWRDFYSDETLASEEANPTLLRDFAATTVDLLDVSDVADFEIAGGTTYLTPSSLDSPGVQEYIVGARRRLAGKGFVQAHVSSYHSPNLNADQPQETPAYENLFLTQVQYTDEEAVAAVFDWFEEQLASLNPEGILLTTSIPGGTTRIISAESQVETEYGLTRRLSTVARAGRHIATGTYDTYDLDNESALVQQNVNYAVFSDLLAAYGADSRAGEVGQEARRVVPWIPLVSDLAEFRYYYGIVGGEVVPRVGVPTEQMVAENPWVQTALFGSFFLTGGWAPTAVYFDVRGFPDQEASDEYFGQLPDLFQTYRGPDWIFAQSYGSYVASLVSHHEHAATWNPAEGTYLVGTHIAAQVGTIVVGIGAFIPFTGDAADFAGLDPRTDPSYDRLRGGAFAMMEEKIAERRRTSDAEDTVVSFSFFPPLRMIEVEFPELWRSGAD